MKRELAKTFQDLVRALLKKHVITSSSWLQILDI